MSKVEDKRRKNLSRVFGELSGIKKRTSEEILEHFEYDMEKAFDYVHSNKGRIDIKSLKEERAPSQAVEIRNSKSNEEKKERRREDEGEQNTGDSDINIRKEMGGRPEIIISGPLEEGNEGEMSGSASENMSNMCELSPQSTCGVITFPRLDLSSLSFFPLGNILEKVFEGRREESLKPEVATPSKLSVSLPSPSLKWRGSLSAPLSPLAGPINIPIPHIDINTPHALNAPNNTPIISTRKPVIDHKDWTEHNSALSQITNWKEVPPWELKAIFQYEITQEGRKLEDDAICSICREDLYQNIYSDHTFHIMQSGASFHGYEVVLMKNCHYHFFHKTCLEQMALVTMGEGYIKCPICSSIYGLMTGDMPSGKMEIAFHQGIHCEGYIDSGVIQINYTFYDGLLPDSTPYHGSYTILYIYIYIYLYIYIYI